MKERREGEEEQDIKEMCGKVRMKTRTCLHNNLHLKRHISVLICVIATYIVISFKFKMHDIPQYNSALE